MFAYTALDASGRKVKGVLTVDSHEQALVRLGELSLHVLTLVETRSRPHRENVPVQELLIFTRLLSRLFKAKVPVLRAFELLRDEGRSRVLREVSVDLLDHLKKGGRLSDGLAAHPRVFTGVYVGLVRAGETGGALDAVFEKIYEFLETSYKTRRELASVLVYPAIVLVLATIVLLGVVVFLVPGFRDLYADLGAPVPFITRFLFGVSSIVTGHPAASVAVIAALIAAVVLPALNPAFRRKLRARLPVVRDYFKRIESERISFALGVLLGQGVRAVEALKIVSTGLPDSAAAANLDLSVDELRKGKSLSRALAASGVFSPASLQLLAGGEEASRVEEMLLAVSGMERERLEFDTRILLALLQPLLILLLGFVVGFIVLSIFIPIFNAVNFV